MQFVKTYFACLCSFLAVSLVMAACGQQDNSIQVPGPGQESTQTLSRELKYEALAERAAVAMIDYRLRYQQALLEFGHPDTDAFYSEWVEKNPSADEEGELTRALMRFAAESDDELAFRAQLLSLNFGIASVEAHAALIDEVLRTYKGEDYVSGFPWLVTVRFSSEDLDRLVERLENLAIETDNDAVRGNTYVALANEYYRRSQNASLPLDTSRRMLARARSYAEKITEEYADLSLERTNPQPVPDMHERFISAMVTAGLRSEDPAPAETMSSKDDEEKDRETLGGVVEKLIFKMDHLSIGQRLPEAEAEDLTGNMRAFSENEGKVMIVDFWATWCAPCLTAFPHHADLVNKYLGEPLMFLAVSNDKAREDMDDFLKENDYPFEYRYAPPDGELIARWNIVHLPTTYLVDHNGIIRGAVESLEPEELDRIVGGLIQDAKASL